MKAFVFSLEGVLRYKRQRERMAELREMQQRAVVEIGRRRVEEFRGQLQKLAETMSAGPGPAGWPARFELTVRTEEALRQALRELEKAQQVLAEASRERLRWKVEVESLEVLRQERLDEHRREALWQEHLRQDELGLRRWSPPERT